MRHCLKNLFLFTLFTSINVYARGEGNPGRERPNILILISDDQRWDQYMLGSELIIAPVIEENATSKEVYLPEGEWIYFWTNEICQGGDWVRVGAPVDWIPIFIKKNTSSKDIKDFFSATRELKLTLY